MPMAHLAEFAYYSYIRFFRPIRNRFDYSLSCMNIRADIKRHAYKKRIPSILAPFLYSEAWNFSSTHMISYKIFKFYYLIH